MRSSITRSNIWGKYSIQILSYVYPNPKCQLFDMTMQKYFALQFYDL